MLKYGSEKKPRNCVPDIQVFLHDCYCCSCQKHNMYWHRPIFLVEPTNESHIQQKSISYRLQLIFLMIILKFIKILVSF